LVRIRQEAQKEKSIQVFYLDAFSFISCVAPV